MLRRSQADDARRRISVCREEMNGHDGEIEDNKFLSWGSGEFGQHCHGVREDIEFKRALVERFSGNQKPKFVACGASHTIVVSNKNEIFAWGNSNSGQLGTDTTETCREPQQIILYENQLQAGNPHVAGVACGGRHSVVWLTNGHVFSFGNNFYAQLGYDFKEKNFKENQAKPHLLKCLLHNPVAQVACGEKHTVFRFVGGAIACVGSNANGQIGTGSRDIAPVPKFVEIGQRVKSITCGANHSLAITEDGEVYTWGYGKACGNKHSDCLSPVKVQLRQNNAVQVAGGSFHSMVRTASGSVYIWGAGSEGQLGFGTQIIFLSRPRRLNNTNVRRSVVQIAAGEAFSAAITENGDLFMWGKNSHIITPGKPSSQKFWSPVCVNKGGKPVKSVFCGSWHSVAIAGVPVPLLHTDSDSEESDIESNMVETRVKVHGISQNGVHNEDSSSETEEDVNDLPHIPLKKESTTYDREGTKLSIAEFYAPDEEDEQIDYKAPSPSFLKESKIAPVRSVMSTENKPESAKSRIVVQVPALNFVDVATSPIPFSSSDSESEIPQSARSLAKSHRSARSVLSVKEAVVSVDPDKKNAIPADELDNETERQEEVEDNVQSVQIVDNYSFHSKAAPSSYERDKVCVSTHNHPNPIRQYSKSSADNFIIPRENSLFTSRQIDFKEVEYARAISTTKAAPEKIYWMNKLNESRANDSASASRYVNEVNHSRIPTQESHLNSRDSIISRGTFSSSKYSELQMARSGRHSEASVINLKGYERGFDGTPTKWTRGLESSLTDYGKNFATPQILEEARRAARLPPRNTPSRSIPKKSPDVNFALQIYKTDTIIAPLRNPSKSFNPKLNPMERYASVHNPVLSTSKNADKKSKLGLVTPRKVSIPGGRAAGSQEEIGDLCIQGQTGMKNIVMYSSATSWRDKGDWARLKAAKSASNSPMLVQIESRQTDESRNFEENEEGNRSRKLYSRENEKLVEDSEEIEDDVTTDIKNEQKGPEVFNRTNDSIDSNERVPTNPIIRLDDGNIKNSSTEHTNWSNKGFMPHRRKTQTTVPQTG